MFRRRGKCKRIESGGHNKHPDTGPAIGCCWRGSWRASEDFAGESLLGFGSRQLEQILGIERIEIRGDIFAMDSVQSSSLPLQNVSDQGLLSHTRPC